MSRDSIIGFLVLCVFFSIVGISSFVSYHTTQITKIENELRSTQKEKTMYAQQSDSLQHTLSVTRDSLNNSLSRDVLWLTRAIYSETDQPTEMYYVAHVVKNRVQSCYRKKCTYREVVLDPYQFSAFNGNNQYYRHVTHSTARYPNQWVMAEQVALDAYMEDTDPTQGSMWFFSQVSMRNHSFPNWALAEGQVNINVVDDWRFRFYNKVKM